MITLALSQLAYGFFAWHHKYALGMFWICWQPIVLLYRAETVEVRIDLNIKFKLLYQRIFIARFIKPKRVRESGKLRFFASMAWNRFAYIKRTQMANSQKAVDTSISFSYLRRLCSNIQRAEQNDGEAVVGMPFICQRHCALRHHLHT